MCTVVRLLENERNICPTPFTKKENGKLTQTHTEENRKVNGQTNEKAAALCLLDVLF